MLRTAALYGCFILSYETDAAKYCLSFGWFQEKQNERTSIRGKRKKEVQQDGFPVLNIMYNII